MLPSVSLLLDKIARGSWCIFQQYLVTKISKNNCSNKASWLASSQQFASLLVVITLEN